MLVAEEAEVPFKTWLAQSWSRLVEEVVAELVI